MEAAMVHVSLSRLYLLRAMYLFIVVGFGAFIWPGILHHEGPKELMQGVVDCMLIAFWTLALFGLRYPLQMLPVLMWEFVWKAVWLLSVALPAWQSGSMDAGTQANTFACFFALLIPFVMPWRYVFAHYVTKRGDPWRAAGDQRAEAGTSIR
jgi:hypothetical protein